jgi:hypothetical protein
MNRYLDGRLEISNTCAECRIKLFGIGRMNRLFSKMPKGARTSVVYSSIVVIAMENGLNIYRGF